MEQQKREADDKFMEQVGQEFQAKDKKLTPLFTGTIMIMLLFIRCIQ